MEYFFDVQRLEQKNTSKTVHVEVSNKPTAILENATRKNGFLYCRGITNDDVGSSETMESVMATQM